MAAGRWKTYEETPLELGQALLDFGSGLFRMALFAAPSNANVLAGNKALADLTDELPTANGYTGGGTPIAGVTWLKAGNVSTLSSANATWMATGGALTARYAVIYKVGTFGGVVDPLLCVSLLDTTPADVTAPDGQPFTVAIVGGGILQLVGAGND